MATEPGSLVDSRELQDGYREIGGNHLCEFERSLRKRFLPATCFEHAQHFGVLKGREGSREVSFASRAQRPAYDCVAKDRAAAHGQESDHKKNQQAWQEIR